jgi:hypothetical protein
MVVGLPDTARHCEQSRQNARQTRHVARGATMRSKGWCSVDTRFRSECGDGLENRRPESVTECNIASAKPCTIQSFPAFSQKCDYRLYSCG